MNSDDAILDAKSGISIEEQKEILSAINRIAEKNRSSLSYVRKTPLNAKKSGLLFPLAVNIAAVIILCGGVFAVISLNRQADEQNRTGNAVYNLTERALIEEIRKDTAEKIAVKEKEITSIAFRLEQVDAQLMEFISSNEELTAEQLASQRQLLTLQLSYREELAVLQEERADILEEARSKEARLRALLEERSKEFSAVQKQAAGELNAARTELARLFGLQEKVENLEALIAHIQTTGAQENIELRTRNTQMESRIADMQNNINTLNEGNSALMRRASELDETAKTLQSEKNSLSQTVASRDNAIRDLQSQNNSQTQEIANLRNQLDIIRQALLE